MSTPRTIRVLRAPDLASYRSSLVDVVRALDAERAADTFILVPTRAAADQLARTITSRLEGASFALPHIGSRADLYDALIGRLASPPRILTPFEREAMLAAGAREADDVGVPAPFHVRPSLIAEMLALYDHVRRVGRSVDDFDRLLSGELEPAAESDRGAAQLLEQTRFLSVAYRAYETRLADSGAADEHAARAHLSASAAVRPLRRLILAVGDRPFDADGYWPADVTLLSTIDGLEHIDILSTTGVLDAGYRDRLQLAFVEFDEEALASTADQSTLIVPGEEHAYHYRDREDEIEAVAARLRRDAPPRAGLIIARPLPYLYLAREIFGRTGVAFEAVDTLPLDAEPYAAAVDVVLECAAANFTRRALMALFKSPHFRFSIEDVEVTRESVALLDARMAEQRYLGGIDRLRALAETWTGGERPAAQAAVRIASALAPLLESRPLVEQIDLLCAFLDEHDRDHPGARRRRVRAAVLGALAGLADSYRRHDPAATGTVTELSAALRRWLGTQTFAEPTGTGGVCILDAQAARFADLDDVQVLGLIEGEWPEKPRRNVFYPRSLIAQLEPARPDRIALNEERDHIRSARAMFRDLLGLARLSTRLSTFALESESVVEPSTLLDDVQGFGLPTRVARDAVGLSSGEPARPTPWSTLRTAAPVRDRRRFEGEAGAWVLPRVSVSRVERYLKCPFQFYVSNVLQVEEEPEDETSRSPLERGRFLHELFETFFHEWQARGRGRITAESMDDARALFGEIAEPALRSLPPAEAGLERARLYGSAVGSGMVDRVFAMEAERAIDIRERLMEYELDHVFAFKGEDGTTRDVRLRAKIDRVDLLGDGTFRLIDYKTKYVPDRKLALQLPIYSACVRVALSQSHGRDIRPSEAMYLSFEGPQAVVPLEPATGAGTRSKTTGEAAGKFDEITDAAAQRFVAALDDIAAGHFPARPETKNLCTMCAFTAVCRNVGGAPESANG